MSLPRDPQPMDSAQEHEPGTRTEPIPARPDYGIEVPVLVSSVHPPSAVRWSFWLWVASFVVGLLAIGYSLSKFDALHRLLEGKVRALRPEISADLLDRVVKTTLFVGLASTTGVILVQLLLAVLMRAHRNWARVLLAVVGMLGILGMAYSLVTVDEQARMALPVQAALIVIASVLMFLPSASAWFRRR